MHRLSILFLIVLLGCAPQTEPLIAPETPSPRVVSILPSITEVLFDIGVGHHVIGDSFYTQYPPETADIKKIGGLFDINREVIITLKPDLVILSEENVSLRQSLPLPILIVNHQTLSGVLDSYLTIGEAFGAEVLCVAQQKRQELIDKLNTFEPRKQGKQPIRTLICIDRSSGTGRIQGMYVAGADSFLSEVVTRAGGKNVAASIGLMAPQLSAEGVMDLAPDVIIEIQVSGQVSGRELSDWLSLGESVPAVKNRRILVLDDDFASIPGPRTPMLIEKIVRYFESQEIESRR
jgi:iron complex transport system substrate-binding protein